MTQEITKKAEGLKYMQSKLSGTFIIQFVKYDNKWQFSPSTSAKSEKIKCKTFEQMITKGHDYMAKKFKKKYGYSYKEDFDKESKIQELEVRVRELIKQRDEQLKINTKGMVTGYEIWKKNIASENSNLMKSNSSDSTFKSEACEIIFDTNNIEELTPKESSKKARKNCRKKDVHKEMLKRFKGITIDAPEESKPGWVSALTTTFQNGENKEHNNMRDIIIENIDSIDEWAELNSKDYDTEYVNAYQRIAYKKRMKAKNK